MSRFKMFTLAAGLALGSLTVATEASARGDHAGAHVSGGHFSGGHLSGGHFSGGHVHDGFGFRRGFAFHRGFGFGFTAAPDYYAYYPYDGCWRWRHVWAPYGRRLHRINVCYYPYY